MSLKKPRSDAKLLNLPEEQQAQLAEWLLSGVPYHAARATVAKEFGVTCSLAALSGFYQVVCVPALLKRRSQAVQAAQEIAQEATRTPGHMDAATVDAIRQKAFELAISPSAAAKDVKALFMLLQKAQDQKLKEQQIALESRRVAILESKLAQVQAAVSEAKAAGGITAETLAKIEAAAKIL